MVKLSQVKVRRSKANPDKYEVVGGGFPTLSFQSKATAKDVAGARRRVLIKRTLRKLGIRNMPRSLIKETKKGL